MEKSKLLEAIQKFRHETQDYRKLLSESRNYVLPTIEKNHDLIDEKKSKLISTYASLEKLIKRIGNNPRMNDGVWKIWYPAYDNAFSSDILNRRGPSLNAVLEDLDYIIGKLNSMDQEELDALFVKREKAPEKHHQLINRWNWINPFWLLWKITELAWRHKIITLLLALIGFALTVLGTDYELLKQNWQDFKDSLTIENGAS